MCSTRAPGAPSRSTLQLPGGTGGVNWGGPAIDPNTGYVIVNNFSRMQLPFGLGLWWLALVAWPALLFLAVRDRDWRPAAVLAFFGSLFLGVLIAHPERSRAPAASWRANRRRASRLVMHVTLLAGVVIVSFPTFWMFSASLMTRAEIFDPTRGLLPTTWQFDNYLAIFRDFNFGTFITNSMIITGSVVLLNLLLCSMAGYGLAKFEFPGRNLLFLFIVSTIFIPFTVIMIPLYLMVRGLGWINTYQGLIMPFAVIGFGVFLMRQYMSTLNDEYLDAARVDGASEWRIYWSIVLPLMRPALVTLAVLVFITNWDEFLGPLVVATDDSRRPLTIGLARFLEQYQNEWHLLMAGAVVAALPPLLLFVALRRYFLASLGGVGGVKG
jgi:multiple sugar transport system permease protein